MEMNMIDDIKIYLKEIMENQKINFLREYLQQIVLKIISDSGFKNNLVFTGGTALRLIYKTNRFSEDLDFSLINKRGYALDKLIKEINFGLKKYGFSVEITKIEKKTVNSFFIRFTDILYLLNLAIQPNQKLSIKIEIDTNPPKGGVIKEYIFYDRFYFLINHFSRESLFSLKLHAILFRHYEKGRDFYDLSYFLSKQVKPDLELFNNAVRQTNPEQKEFTLDRIFTVIKNKIENLNEKKIIKDLQPFLLNPDEINLINKKNLLLFLNNYKENVL